MRQAPALRAWLLPAWFLSASITFALAFFAPGCGEKTQEGEPGAPAGDAGMAGDAPASGETPPVASITAPEDGTVVSLGEPVTLTALVGDADRKVTELEYRWKSDRDGVLEEGSVAGPKLELVRGGLSAGLHEVKLTVADPTGRVAEDVVTIRVNRPPEGDTLVSIEPPSPTTSDTLKAKVAKKALDPEGEAVEILYQWFSDGVDVGISSDTVPAPKTARGQVWKVLATPTDGHAKGKPAEAEVTIANAPPSVAKAAVLPSAGGTDTTFTCSAEGWKDADGDAAAVLVQWKLNGHAVEGETSATITGDHYGKGDELTCVLTPTDGIDEGTPVESDAVPILDTPPSVAEVLVLPMSGDKSTTFTCKPLGMTDPDEGDVPQTKMVWVVNGTDLPGTTSVSFSAASLSKGAELRCKVVPFSGTVEGSAVLSKPIVIANAPPAVSSVVQKPVPATEQTVLTCVPAQPFDLDGDNVAFLFAWFVDGVPVEGETGDTLGGEHFDKGQKVRCEVTPFDGTDQGAPVSSKFEVTISNSPPGLASVQVTPAEGSKLATFTCVPVGFSDPDAGDEPSYTYEWRLNGEVIPGGIFSTLKPKGLPPGDLTCVVTPSDGTGDGEPVQSPPAKLSNYAPSITGVEVSPSQAFETSTLKCLPKGFYDADEDPEGYVFGWIVNGVAVAGASADTLTGAHFDKGQVVICTAAPFDGAAQGDGHSSKPVQIGNSPPGIQSVALSPLVGGKKTTFTCLPKGFSDPDAGDPELYAYSWILDGATVNGAKEATFVPGAAGGGTLKCSVEPFDGTDFGEAKTSGTATITNVPPSVAQVSITPASPVTANDLQCVADGLSDPDGDPVKLAFEWFVNDALLPEAETAVLAAAKHGKKDKVFCRVTPSDGELPGTPKLSAPVIIGNTPPGSLEVAIQPSPPSSTAPFECVVTKASIDPDGDPVEIAFEWLADEAPAGWTDPVVPGGTAASCATWQCEATPGDGEAAGPTASAEAVVDGGSALGIGSGGWVEIPSSPSLSLATGQLNVELWLYVAAYQAGVIAGKRNTGPLLSDRGFALSLQADGKVVFGIDIDTAAPKTATSTAKVPLGTWTHLAGSYDGKTARLYIDGKWQASVSVIGPIDTTAPLRIGRNGPGDEPPYPLTALVDEVRIRDKALYTADFTPTMALGADAATVGLYHLNEASGPKANDSSGKGNHGTLQAGVTWAPGLCGAGTENTPPPPPTVTIAPAAPLPGQALTCTAKSVDPDGDPVTYKYAWSVEGSPVLGQTNATLQAGLTKACEVWTCQAIASDGQSTSAPAWADVQVGPGSGTVTWYGHHGYTSGTPVLLPNFVTGEKLASRITLPAGVFPFQLTHVRAYLASGQHWIRVYKGGAQPGVAVATKTANGQNQLQSIALDTPLPLDSPAPIWVSVEGTGTMFSPWSGAGDGNGTATTNLLYCKWFEFLGSPQCDPGIYGMGTPGWGNPADLGPPFTGMGDLVVDIGTASGPGTCD